MRRCALLSLVGFVVIASCYAADADGLSTKVAEVDRDKDGRPDARTEIVSRHGQKQMMVLSRADKSGEWRVTARSFYVGPHMAVTEADEDGDGFFEMVVVYREDPKDLNAFVRERDGSVRPADAKVVEALRKQDAVLSEFWSKTMKGPENFEGAMMEAREKMKEISEGAKKGD
jgi:hypothetical protein